MRILLLATAALALLAGCDRQEPTLDEARVATAAPAAAPARISPAKAKAVMHERHEGMESVGKAMKILSREMKSDAPDMAMVKNSAASMNGLAQKASGWFPAGTGPDVGKTGAKAEIWQKPHDFAAKMKAFQVAANSFNAAAQSGNAGATKAAFGDLGKSCKACHDDYRAKKKD